MAMSTYTRKRNERMTLTKALGILGYDAWSSIDTGKFESLVL